MLILPLLCALAGCSDTDEKPPGPVDVHVPDTKAEDEAAEEEALQAGVNLLNKRRVDAGLEAVVVDEELSIGCLAHVRYMAGESKLVHEQDKDSPWYSVQGATAGPNANIASGITDMSHAVDEWSWSLYQRLAMYDPGVTTVGVAWENNYACLDLFTKFEAVTDYTPVAFPANGQGGVPLSFTTDGVVNPIPGDIDLPTGPIVSLLFPPAQVVAAGFQATVIVEATGEQLKGFVRLPKDPTDPYATFQLNAVTITPLKPLEPSETYRVTMKGEVDEAVFERQWTFTTAAE